MVSAHSLPGYSILPATRRPDPQFIFRTHIRPVNEHLDGKFAAVLAIVRSNRRVPGRNRQWWKRECGIWPKSASLLQLWDEPRR